MGFLLGWTGWTREDWAGFVDDLPWSLLYILFTPVRACIKTMEVIYDIFCGRLGERFL